MQITEEDRRIAESIAAALPLEGEKAQDHLAAPGGPQGPVLTPLDGLAEWLRVEAEATQLFDLPEEADMLRRWASEVERANADAARYRWLRQCVNRAGGPVLAMDASTGLGCPGQNELFDTAIDAARGAA